MKKKLSLFLVLVLLVANLTACGNKSVEPENTSDFSVVTTIFPEYDWTRNIIGDTDADLTMLINSGVDLHSFQPSADDIIKISECDVFIYVGGESDEWVEDALKEAVNKDMIVVNLMDALGDKAKEEEAVEGMQAEDEHEHEGEEAEEHEDEEGPEYDEHVWLSVKNAAILCTAIEEALAKANPDNAEAYAANLEAYIAQLNDLDAKYQEAVDVAKVKTLLFGDRFPFRYLVDDYGLEYYAAFLGCSAESEASFETIAFLAGKVDELGLKTVMTLEGTDHSIADTVVQTSKKQSAEIKSMDSMQSITAEDVDGGASYLAIMEKNLDVLKEALK